MKGIYTNFYAFKIHVHENKKSPKGTTAFHHAKQLITINLTFFGGRNILSLEHRCGSCPVCVSTTVVFNANKGMTPAWLQSYRSHSAQAKGKNRIIHDWKSNQLEIKEKKKLKSSNLIINFTYKKTVNFTF